MQQNHDSSLLLPCLARQILTDYPGETKQKFYALWLKNHNQASLDNLRRLVSLEYRNFCGWCALHGYVPAFPMFKTYSECNPVRSLTEDTIISGEPAPRPPWWSEIPNARPRVIGCDELGVKYFKNPDLWSSGCWEDWEGQP